MSSELEESWTQYRRLVLAELKRLDSVVCELDHKIDEAGVDTRRDALDAGRTTAKDLRDIQMDLTTLKVQAGAWGAAAGVIGGAAVTTIISFLFRSAHVF